MRRGAILGLLLAASVLAACADSPPDSEEALATFRRLRAYLRAENYGAVYDMLSSEDRRRMDARLDQLRREMDRAGQDPELEEKYQEMAKALEVTREELRAITARDLFIRSTTRRSKDTDELLRWAKGEVDEPPRIEGDRCTLLVRLPRGRKGGLRLIAEDGRWRLVLRGF